MKKTGRIFRPVFFLTRAICVLLAVCTTLQHVFTTQCCAFLLHRSAAPLFTTRFCTFLLHHIAALLQHCFANG